MKNLLIVTLLSILALNLSAHENLSGTYKTGEDNTLVKIEKQGDVFIGKVISSDDENAKPGTLIIKDLKQKKEKWKGQIFILNRQEWHDATFKIAEDKLTITVTLLFISKSVDWTKRVE